MLVARRARSVLVSYRKTIVTVQRQSLITADRGKKTKNRLFPILVGSIIITGAVLPLYTRNSEEVQNYIDESKIGYLTTVLRIIWNKMMHSGVHAMTVSVIADLSGDPSFKDALIDSSALKSLLRLIRDGYCSQDAIRAIRNLSKVENISIELRKLEHVSALMKILEFQGVHNAEDVEMLGKILQKIVKNPSLRAFLPLKIRDTLADLRRMTFSAIDSFSLFALWGINEIAEQGIENKDVSEWLRSKETAEMLYKVSELNAERQFMASKILRNITEKYLDENIKVEDKVIELWLNKIFDWITEPNTSIKKEAIYSLAAIAKDRRYIEKLCLNSIKKETKGISILLQLARELHSLKLKSTSEEATKEMKDIRKCIVSIVCSISNVAGFSTSYLLDSNATTRVDPTFQKIFQDAQDLVDLPLQNSIESLTLLHGWVDILIGWTGEADESVRKGAIQTLSNLVQFGKHQDLVLLQWMVKILQAIQERKPSVTLKAIRNVEVTAEHCIRESIDKANFIAHVPTLEAGFEALSILANGNFHQIIQQGGLELCFLMYDQGNTKVKAQCMRLLANLIATCCNVLDKSKEKKIKLEDMLEIDQVVNKIKMKNEVLSKLKNWNEIEDITLKFQSLRALENIKALNQRMDVNVKSLTNLLPYYEEGVHLLHPQNNILKELNTESIDQNKTTLNVDTDVDIVFVHGLRGDPITTWRSEIDSTTIWPNAWLSSDLLNSGLNSRIITLGYEADIVTWSSPWPSLPLKERAKEMLKSIFHAQIGQNKKPVIFITHSMGGLLVKEMLLLALEDKLYSSILKSTQGIVFLAVPHTGANFGQKANAEAIRSVIQAHPATKDLSFNDPSLLKLNESFQNIIKNIHILSIAEGKSSPIGLGLEALIVLPASANPGYGTFLELSDFNHMTVCKPTHNNDERYILLYNFILECLNIKKIS